MRAPIAVLLTLAGFAGATTPSVAVDPRLELDGLFQVQAGSTPEGFVVPPASIIDITVSTPSAAVPAADFSARAQVLLRLGPPPGFHGLDRVPDSVVDAAGGRPAVEAWIAALRALAPAGAPALADEARALAPAVEAFRVRLASGNYIAAVEEYAGLPLPGPHRISLSAFHAAGSIANVVLDRADGGVEIDSLFGPEWTPRGADFWTTRVPGTLWHEQAHGVTDPLADLWAQPIERRKPSDPAAICYGSWRQCVREHVVRAVMLRLMERRLGPAAASEQRRFEKHGDFRWLEKMEERLKEYEADRKRYPTLADFYPRLLEVLGPGGADAGFDPRRETDLVRARAGRFARAALKKAVVPEVRRRLGRAVPAAGQVPATPRNPAAVKAANDAIAAFGAGRREEALTLFDRALALDPADAEAALSRATVLESLGRDRDALAAYAAAAAVAGSRTGRYQPRVHADAAASEARLRKKLERK